MSAPLSESAQLIHEWGILIIGVFSSITTMFTAVIFAMSRKNATALVEVKENLKSQDAALAKADEKIDGVHKSVDGQMSAYKADLRLGFEQLLASTQLKNAELNAADLEKQLEVAKQRLETAPAAPPAAAPTILLGMVPAVAPVAAPVVPPAAAPAAQPPAEAPAPAPPAPPPPPTPPTSKLILP